MILDDLVSATRTNLQRRLQHQSLTQLKHAVAEMPPIVGFPFEAALRQPEMTMIAEIKQASPSKGQIIAPEAFDYRQIAQDYANAGVDMISVLTEETYFKGSLAILATVNETVDVPLLRKDFIIAPEMIYEARVAGAHAILLIVAILTDAQLAAYIRLADTLGLSALVEAHDEAEIQRALQAKARIIGVNNRNLKDFSVDFNNTRRLRHLVPESVLFISESGIQTRADVETLENAHVNGILIGETLMRAADKGNMIKTLKG
ncbi:indole-3-glycerol phosphate synthase TrpC [Leuconostoc holzapfelii]|uniref:Indole-3-glycerol phosphate synthase n=1 Tax=Leuconostoc holzapfelii TaxID=434464 RepID=A0ABT2NXZ3_9LACO|nr:indole-3-glycerol phosphate synthase TrpC [Leuconostoc holzapfelii]MCT8389987.1 indole-3-glycerol phosphate synthase TrpC [Leuconostoc holzapfelii]